MKKSFFDICYEILSHYLHFPDVSDTCKSIDDLNERLRSYPQTDWEFDQKRLDIIFFIKKLRDEYTLYLYQLTGLLPPPTPSGRTLFDDNRDELFIELVNEKPKLIIKGIHQIVRHCRAVKDNNELMAELFTQDTAVLQKYGLLNGEEM